MELPDDVINIIIDTILPKNIHDSNIKLYKEYEQYSALELNNWKIQLKIYSSINSINKSNDVCPKIIYTSLYTLKELRNTNTILQYLVDEKCKYDIEFVIELYIRYFQYYIRCHYITSIIYNLYKKSFYDYDKDDIHKLCTKKKNYITHCNSGCIVCKKYLPYWWPSLEHQAPTYISSSVIEEWNKKTDTYIRDGCCSFKCYKLSRPFNSSKYIQNGERVLMFCQYENCSIFIHPTDIKYDIHFCSEYCKSNYEDTLLFNSRLSVLNSIKSLQIK
jgi:hypothetical protein